MLVIWLIRKRAAYGHSFEILARAEVRFWVAKNRWTEVKNDRAVLAADHGIYTKTIEFRKKKNKKQI